MADSSECPTPTPMETSELTISMLPTEVVFLLFKFVLPKDLIRCRQVCVKWRDVIDAMLKDDSLWEQFCRCDYNKIYKQAMWKSPNITTWFELYRSLSIWPRINSARDTVEEYCISDTIDEEMRSAVIQENGIVMILKRTYLVYHKLLTMDVARRKGSDGQYTSIQEFKDVVVMLGFNGHLHIVNKPKHNWTSDLIINTNEDDEIWFENVMSFIVVDRTVFFITYRHDLFSFHFDNDKTAHRIILPEQLYQGIPEGLGALGYTGGCLYILTMSHNMYKYVDKMVTLVFDLGTVRNLMDCLYKHNMLENIEWRHYYILLSHLNHVEHKGHLRYIIKMHVYRDDLFFVASQSGVVSLYYKPMYKGQLDLSRFSPIKVYDFTSRIVAPILSAFPIQNIEVAETKDGHIVLVCMQRKILVITYTHKFEQPVSQVVVPCVAMAE